MNSIDTFYLQSLTRRFENDCRNAQQQVARQPTIPDVIRQAHVHADPVIRSFSRSLACHKALQATIADKLDELISAQLAKVGAVSDLGERKSMIDTLRDREWNILRGDYGMHWRKADAAARQLLSL